MKALQGQVQDEPEVVSTA